MQSEINSLLQIIENQLGWGDTAEWKGKDFELLNQLIFDKTKISLSASTLRRIWGRVEYNHLPSVTTLDTLAGFAGFENWRAFLKTNTPRQYDQKAAPQLAAKISRSRKSILFAIVIAVLILLCASGTFMLSRSRGRIDPGKYTFDSQRLTRGIPNSVIFDYDASSSPTDSIYIQQSWDPRTKTLVRRNVHQFTSVYYEPGFYQAKLVIGGKIVKQHKLMIPTSGWLGLIENKPVPYYLKLNDFVFKDGLKCKVTSPSSKSDDIALHVPYIKYYNVGNFPPVPLSGFSYKAMVKTNIIRAQLPASFRRFL